MAATKCTEQELYTVLETGWNSCLEYLPQFTLFSPKYDAAFVAGRLAAVQAARALPDEAQRNATFETARLKLSKDARICCDRWQSLKIYISEAFPADQHSILFKEAGANYYERAANENWESVTGLMSSGANFLDNHSAQLLADDNMPTTFTAEFNSAKSDFATQHQTFLQAEEAARVGTGVKNQANEDIHDKGMSMFLTGQDIFRNNPDIRPQFVFESVLSLVSGAGSAGFKGLITDSVTDLPIAGAKLGAIGTVKVTTSDPEGRYRLVLASGMYSILIEAEGYQPTTLTDREVKVGTVTTINIQLIPITT